ncbi:MAG: hypothetical protein ACREOI_00975 [bacterium]
MKAIDLKYNVLVIGERDLRETIKRCPPDTEEVAMACCNTEEKAQEKENLQRFRRQTQFIFQDAEAALDKRKPAVSFERINYLAQRCRTSLNIIKTYNSNRWPGFA